MLQFWASLCRILSVASDAPVRGTWFTPGRSSPGASAPLHSAPIAPFRGFFLTFSLRRLGCSSPWHRVLSQTIQSEGLGRAPLRPGCSKPGRPFDVFSPLPRTLQSVAPGSPPDDPVRGLLSLAPCPVPRFVVCCARFPGSRHPVAVVAWHLSSRRGCGRRCASLACLVAPRWCPAPRPVRSLSVLRSAFPSPWCLPPPLGLSPPALLSGCAGHAEAGREPGSLCLPLAPAVARALGALRVGPVRGPAMGLSLAGPSGFGLGLRGLRWLACVDPVTDASGFPYRPSFDGGLGRCTGAVSCGRRHRPFRVGGRHARVPRVCACACPARPGRAGRPRGRVLVRLTFPSAVLGSLFACSAPSGLGLPCLWLLLVFFFPFPPLVAPSLCPALSVFRPRLPWALASCSPRPPPLFLGPPPPPPMLSLAFPAFRFSRASAPPPFFLFFLFPVFFLPVGAGLSVLGRHVCPRVPRWCCSCRCSVCAGWCCMVFAVGPGCPLLSPAGSWCRASVVLSLSGRVARRPVVRRVVSWYFSCPVLCSVALCCGVVVCCRALPFVCVVACARCLFLAAVRLLCVFWGVVLCVPCPLRPVRCCAALCWCPFVVLCASSVLFPVDGVVGSWSRSLLLGVCWWLWLPGVVVWWCVSALVPVSGLAGAGRLPCGVLLPCAVSCGAVLPCGAVPCCPVFFFFFFSLLVALVSCCPPLVLGSAPVPGRFFFCALPVRCCAGVPASLLSVRCSLALAGLAGVLCCCLLCLCVCCWPWLSSVVSWWVLVAPGVVSRWRAVVCPWVLWCAVLLRVVPPGVALLCAVLLRFALFGAAARSVVSWGAVRCLGVLCPLAPCFILSPRAVCILLWRVAAFFECS